MRTHSGSNTNASAAAITGARPKAHRRNRRRFIQFGIALFNVRPTLQRRCAGWPHQPARTAAGRNWELGFAASWFHSPELAGIEN